MAVIENFIKEDYALYNGDSCQVLPQLPSGSVDLSVYSPPFSELYNYSSADEDLSNCANYDEFLVHYEFIVKELSRLTKPGRMNIIHSMDIMNKNMDYTDFPGDIVRLYKKHGFTYCGRIMVWKEPFAVRLRTMVQSLTHKNIVENSTSTAPANPDYLIIMKKGGQIEEPVRHDEGLVDFAGELDPTRRAKLGLSPIPDENLSYRSKKGITPRENKWSHWIWRQYASSVWKDVRPGHLLPYHDSKEEDSEKHICPLQLDTIDRIIELYSNTGDTILTPFLGVGSEAYCAVKKNRKAIGIELKKSYFDQACKNLSRVEDEKNNQPDIFESLV